MDADADWDGVVDLERLPLGDPAGPWAVPFEGEWVGVAVGDELVACEGVMLVLIDGVSADDCVCESDEVVLGVPEVD